MFKGKVVSGEGKASEFLMKKPYREFIEKKLGFKPYAGTLNLETNPDKFSEFKENIKSFKMQETKFNGIKLGGIDIYPVKIEGEKAGIVEPEKSRYGDDIVEVVAAGKLRDLMDLKDGDEISIESYNR